MSSVHRNPYVTSHLTQNPCVISLNHPSKKFSVQTKPLDPDASRTLFQLRAKSQLNSEDSLKMPKRGLFGRVRKKYRVSSSHIGDMSSVHIQSGDNQTSYEFKLKELATHLKVTDKELKKHLIYDNESRTRIIVDPKYLTKLLDKQLKQADKMHKIIDTMKASLNSVYPAKEPLMVEKKRKKLQKSLQSKTLKHNEDAQALQEIFEKVEFKLEIQTFSTSGHNNPRDPNNKKAKAFLGELEDFEQNKAWWSKKPTGYGA